MMTNKEVISFLDQVRKILLDDKSWLESTIQPINEAFDMAISAVRAQDVPDTNVSDMISRQAVINALLEEVRLVDGYYVENDEVIDKDDAIEAIRLLPSEQSENIRCYECKHGTHSGCGNVYICNVSPELVMKHTGDFYCGYAERKTDEEVN